MDPATQRDYLKENADNIWFVLGAYFFAFFPWAVMNNIDFISEKWRTCRRTRELARIHLASNILPIIYVAVYAEAQRRKEDNKEFAAALTALMFNVYQLMRTIMGWVQLNAFVAWCKHAVECMEALVGNGYLSSSSSSESTKSNEGGGRERTRRMMKMMGQWQKVIVSWCNRVSHGMRAVLRRDVENSEQCRSGDEENRESSVKVNVDGNDVGGTEEHMGASPGINGENGNAEAEAGSSGEESGQSVECTAESEDGSNESSAENRVDPREVDSVNWIEDEVMVNNMVVDNELGGREVTVFPSLEKVWNGMKRGRFTPSEWLRTDRVTLNTVRWGGAYLCGMGESWSVERYGALIRSECGEILKSFFSREMEGVRSVLQQVDWCTNDENDSSEFLSICGAGCSLFVDLTGEMSTAYGTRLTDYGMGDTFTVDAYSFEFNSLVGSYPSGGDAYLTENRERIALGLVHSVLLVKHLGVEKLQAIRRYYDRYRLPEGAFLRNAFKLLVKQRNPDMADDASIWNIFESDEYQIPIFPYRMQMVALWDEATNWRVSQASAHIDIDRLLYFLIYSPDQNENEKWALHDAPHPVNIFDYCAKWTTGQIERSDDETKGSLGVVMETVRTFLAEWVTASARVTNWEPEIPTACVEFNTGETRGTMEYEYVTWICQRELQRKVAKMPREEENFSGSAALIMLFILGFPCLKMVDVQEAEAGTHDSQDSVREASESLSSNAHRSIDLSARVWRAWTPLAPQQISLIIQIDSGRRSASVRLQNDSGDAQFMWQDWVDAAMGCMKGLEEGKNGKRGYGRKMMRGNLRNPMVEMCPLRMNGDGIDTTMEKTSAARMWMGWPAFDVRICKFEVDQWLHACAFDVREGRVPNEVIESLEGVIEAIVSAEGEQTMAST